MGSCTEGTGRDKPVLFTGLSLGMTPFGVNGLQKTPKNKKIKVIIFQISTFHSYL